MYHPCSIDFPVPAPQGASATKAIKRSALEEDSAADGESERKRRRVGNSGQEQTLAGVGGGGGGVGAESRVPSVPGLTVRVRLRKQGKENPACTRMYVCIDVAYLLVLPFDVSPF